MSRSRCLSPAIGLLVFAVLGQASSDSTVWAQIEPGGLKRDQPVAAIVVNLKEPTASRVYQRDANGTAEIPVVLDDSLKDAELVDVRISATNIGAQGIKLVDGKLVGVPVGGPYTVTCTAKVGKTMVSKSIGPVFVGDLWVLAGQSNMQGVGELIDVTPPHPLVKMLGMDGKWMQAEEPLHWLVDSPDPVHSLDPKTRAERSAKEHKTRKKGAGLGLPFAVAMVQATGVPVGLVICAHGGTSMGQWSPAKKDEGGNSLYGSMLRQFHLAGGKVKGVLWYQGESDAMTSPETARAYPKVFSDFIAAVRADFGQPELPFYFAQLCRYVTADPKGWNAVQDAERMLVERVPNTAVVATIDLELDDGIHVGTQGLKRLGQRFARIAQRELFGQLGATTPTFDRVTRGPNGTLVVKFKDVNMRPAASTMMGGMGGGTMSPGEHNGIGLKPERHIAGFSIRREDGTNIPLIYEAAVGKARDTVVLKLDKALSHERDALVWPRHRALLQPDRRTGHGSAGLRPDSDRRKLEPRARRCGRSALLAAPIKLLIITGDHGHAWKETTKVLEDFLAPAIGSRST